MFNFFNKQSNLEDLPKNPVDFMLALSKRKYWCDINPRILLDIANQAKGSHEEVLMFAYISELSGLVKTSFIQSSKESQGDVTPQVMFGCALYLLGIRHLREFRRATSPQDKKLPLRLADMAFMASVLCDPLQINTYAYWANLYAMSKKEVALEMCEKYRETLDALLNAPLSSLSSFHQSLRMDIQDPTSFQNFFEKASGTRLNSSESSSARTIMNYVQELENALLNFDPNFIRDDDFDRLEEATYQML